MSDTRQPLRIPKPWKMELLWAKEGKHFGSRRIRSFETEQARDSAIEDAQADGWRLVRTWSSEADTPVRAGSAGARATQPPQSSDAVCVVSVKPDVLEWVTGEAR